ncbi:transmembrane protein PVRIG isoform X1 [Dasypus novemcinctus]|uniref:transmembrane protein PVRIG isoform X1 n=1 Tax=Dasypus novemcinctus TaxID=9361 RepID=UPI00265F00FD|nr:transmembrane protein PVRIG isoform X1 [Dasypus novemcinctus]
MRTEARCHPDSPRARGGSMDGPQGLGLLLALLSLCITAGTPEVWARVQREATAVASFTVHCGFLGSGSISLVTVSWGGPDGAGGTRLAVLHPEFGTQLWVPAHQAQWETRSSISLTLEAPEGTSPSPNTTFCCKFVSFPEGSQEACRDLLSTDQGGMGRGGPGGQAGPRGPWAPSWPASLSAQGSLPPRRPPFCRRAWLGSWGSPVSSSWAAACSCTSCSGRGTGLSLSLSHPSPGPRHRCKLGPSRCPTPPSTPATATRQPWTWPSAPTTSPRRCPCQPLPVATTTSPRWCPCQPLPAAASSPLRTDSMPGQEGGPPRLAPSACLSPGPWSPGPWRDA